MKEPSIAGCTCTNGMTCYLCYKAKIAEAAPAQGEPPNCCPTCGSFAPWIRSGRIICCNDTWHDRTAPSRTPVAQGLEEIASRIYLEKFTRKDDPDVIGAAIVSYGIDVLTDYARQSQERKYPWPVGDGDYSCATCGFGMKEPCVHWLRMELANSQEHVAELERELAEANRAVLGWRDAAANLGLEPDALNVWRNVRAEAACDELDRLIAKYVCWNSACKDESHVQIKAKAAEIRGSK